MTKLMCYSGLDYERKNRHYSGKTGEIDPEV